MKAKRRGQFLLLIAALVVMAVLLSAPALAQCAMCKNAVTGSPSAAKLSESLNFAILVLLIPPVLIFCGIFFVAYRYRKSRGAELKSISDDEPPGQDTVLVNSSARHKQGRGERKTGGALA